MVLLAEVGEQVFVELPLVLPVIHECRAEVVRLPVYIVPLLVAGWVVPAELPLRDAPEPEHE